MDGPAPKHILRSAASCAIQAPSSHNTQPWRLRRRGESLELWIDPERHLEVVDPLRRQLTISCGCALYNARVAIRAAGYLGQIEILPRTDQPELIAVVRLGLPREPTDQDRNLLAAIPQRRTNRRPFFDRPVATTQAELLAQAARAERTRMLRLTPDEKLQIAAIVAEFDRRRFAEPEYRAQVSEWLAPTGSFRKDGIPFAEKEYGSRGRFAVGRSLRDPGLGDQFAAIEVDRILGAPLVAVFATEANDDLDWVDCGQALQAVLLRATALGLSAAFVDQVLEFEDLHKDVTALIGGVLIPQLVVRFGYAPPVEHLAPRRDLDDVYEEHD